MERIEYRPSVETSADVTIDHLVVDLSGFEDIDKEAVARILGPDGALARMGVVDGKTVVMSFGGGLARFNKLVAMVRAGEAPLALDAAIARSAGKVTGRRWFEVYLSVDRWVRLVSQMHRADGAFGRSTRDTGRCVYTDRGGPGGEGYHGVETREPGAA